MVKFVSEDGRAFTDYRPNCVMNEEIKKSNQITNSFEYSKFLQMNAEKIMDNNRVKVTQKYKKKGGDCSCNGSK